MMKTTCTGDQMLAMGAVAAGISLATSYPGSPGSGVIQELIERSEAYPYYVEWSANEKVAIEMGIGASMAGRRALVVAKSVGMNLMVDPLMTANLTRIHGGLVILLGDDPGAYGSQNDQDTRPLFRMLEIPLLEPHDPESGRRLMQEAFTLSETFELPIALRITRNFSQARIQRDEAWPVFLPQSRRPDRNADRFTPSPRTAVQKHRELQERLSRFRDRQPAPDETTLPGKGSKGILAAGRCFAKLQKTTAGQLPGSVRILRLNQLFPLPEKVISGFLEACSEILVLEEGLPFVEEQVQALAHRLGKEVTIHPKQAFGLPSVGELFSWQIAQALDRFLPGSTFSTLFPPESEAEEYPAKKDHCAGCRYEEVLDALAEAAGKVGQRPFLIGDPGCLVTVADRLDAKYAMGGAVATADGIRKTLPGERAVAILGDSSFFHTTIPALCNAAVNRSDILVLILDNGSTRTSGFQPNPGAGRRAGGKPAPRLDICTLARAYGVPHVSRHRLGETDLALVFSDLLRRTELCLAVVEIPD